MIKYLPEAENIDISWTLITAALSSVARTSVVTMQDILGLDSSARMNTPATQVIRWTVSDILLVYTTYFMKHQCREILLFSTFPTERKLEVEDTELCWLRQPQP